MHQADVSRSIPNGGATTGNGLSLTAVLGRAFVEQLVESLIEELDALDGDSDCEESEADEDSECLQVGITETGVPIGQLATSVLSEDDEDDFDNEHDDWAAESAGPLRIISGRMIDIWAR